tara:strand:- start:45 stop:635 length:591 start_codon:yes stop_codon:yes gene_type:complete
MPHKLFKNWASAVKEWNNHQAFKNDLYGIPRKGGEFYDEVYQIMYGKPVEAEAKVEAKIENGIPMSDLAEYHNALAGIRPRAAIAYYEDKYPQLKKKDEAKVEDLNRPKPEPKAEPKMSNVRAKAGLYTGKIIFLTEKEAALYKVYNALQRIRSKAVNKHYVYDGHPEVDKANADVEKVQTELRALIKERVGTNAY